MEWSLGNNTRNGQTIIEDIDCYGLAIDKNGDIYISDWVKNEVRRWKRDEIEKTIVASGNGKGDQLNSPKYIFIDENLSLYISDQQNNRIVKWIEDAREGIIVAGGNGDGEESNQLNGPRDLTFDEQDNLYVVDWGNDRIQKFERD